MPDMYNSFVQLWLLISISYRSPWHLTIIWWMAIVTCTTCWCHYLCKAMCLCLAYSSLSRLEGPAGLICGSADSLGTIAKVSPRSYAQTVLPHMSSTGNHLDLWAYSLSCSPKHLDNQGFSVPIDWLLFVCSPGRRFRAKTASPLGRAQSVSVSVSSQMLVLLP